MLLFLPRCRLHVRRADPRPWQAPSLDTSRLAEGARITSGCASLGMQRGTGRLRFNERMVLSPLLSQRIQARAREIFGSHGNPKLYFGVEREKQRFGQPGHIGRTVDVDHKGSPTATVVLGKI